MALKLNRRQLTIAAVLVAVLYVYFILRPSLKAAANASSQARALKKELSAIQSDIASMGKMKEKLDQLKEKVVFFESRLIKEENINILLEELSKMASQSQVRIQGVSPQKPEVQSGAFYGEYPILVEAKGGYHSLGAFINKLEYAKYFLSVKDVKIESDLDNPTSHNCKLLISASYTSVEK